MLSLTVKKMADKEKISALLDGEELDQSIINALAVDKESELVWQNFNLIGDVLRGDVPQGKEWNIAENVALALENEPAHNEFTGNGFADNIIADDRLADISVDPVVVDIKTVDIGSTQEITESQPTPRQAKRTLPAWLTQLGQVAVAASVSLAVIVGVQQYNGGDDGFVSHTTDSQLSVLQTIPFSGKAEPVSLTRDSVRSGARNNAPNEAQLMEQRRRINAMLQDYELQLRFNAEDGSIDRTLLETNSSVAD